MPLSIESEIDLLYHLSTMSEHVLPKGIFYLLLWKRLNQSGNPPAFSFNEMIDHLRILYDESVFDNPELPASNDHDFEWEPIKIEAEQVEQEQQAPPLDKDLSEKMDINPPSTKTRKRAVSPTPSSTPSTPSTDSGRRSSRQRNPHVKDEEEQGQSQQSKADKRKSIKEVSRASPRSVPATDSIGTRLRGQK